MHARLPLLWITVGLIAWLALPAEAAIVRIRNTASISNPVVTLNDVAEVLDNDGGHSERLQGAVLCPAPPPGRIQRLDYATIQTRLTALGFNVQTLEFTGSSQVVISTPAPISTVAPQAAAPQRLQRERAVRAPRISDFHRRKAEIDASAMISDALLHHFPESGRVAVTLSLSTEQVRQLTGLNTHDYTVKVGQPQFEQPQTFELHFDDREGNPQIMQVMGELRPIPKIPTLKFSVPKGHVMCADDLGWTEGNSTQIGGPILDTLETIVGRETTRALRLGDTIGPDDVQTVPLVRTGDIVTVYSRGKGIVIRMEAKARSGGSMGDSVQLTTLDGREKLRAQVTGFHEAEVVSADAAAPETIRFVPEKP